MSEKLKALEATAEAARRNAMDTRLRALFLTANADITEEQVQDYLMDSIPCLKDIQNWDPYKDLIKKHMADAQAAEEAEANPATTGFLFGNPAKPNDKPAEADAKAANKKRKREKPCVQLNDNKADVSGDQDAKRQKLQSHILKGEPLGRKSLSFVGLLIKSMPGYEEVQVKGSGDRFLGIVSDHPFFNKLPEILMPTLKAIKCRPRGLEEPEDDSIPTIYHFWEKIVESGYVKKGTNFEIVLAVTCLLLLRKVGNADAIIRQELSNLHISIYEKQLKTSFCFNLKNHCELLSEAWNAVFEVYMPLV